MATGSENQIVDDSDFDGDSFDPQVDRLLRHIDKLEAEDRKHHRKHQRNLVRRGLEDYADNRRMRRMFGDLDW